MSEFFFSTNGGCTNDTDCQGGKCIVNSSSGIWCECPEWYDPLDNCQSKFGDKMNYIYYGILFAIVYIFHITMIVSIRRKWWSELKKWALQGPCVAPKPMLISMSSVITLSITMCIVNFLYLIQQSDASNILMGIGSTIFVGCFDAIQYFLFILIIKSKNLGHMARTWRILSIIIAVCSGIGLSFALLLGIMRAMNPKNSLLPILVNIAVVIGGIVPMIITAPVCIYFLVWLSKNDRNDRTSKLILWRSIWNILAIMFMMLLNVFLPIGLTGFPRQLFAVITLKRFVVQALVIITGILIVKFLFGVRLKKGASKSNPEIITGTSSKTSSSKVSDSTASTLYNESVSEVEVGIKKDVKKEIKTESVE